MNCLKESMPGFTYIREDEETNGAVEWSGIVVLSFINLASVV